MLFIGDVHHLVFFFCEHSVFGDNQEGQRVTTALFSLVTRMLGSGVPVTLVLLEPKKKTNKPKRDQQRK